MVFQKETNAKNKQKTPMKMKGKKSFDNSKERKAQDSDDEDDGIGGADVDFDDLVDGKEEEKNLKTDAQNETISPVKAEKIYLKSEKTAEEGNSPQKIIAYLPRPRVIYMIGLPMDTTINQVANLYPKARRIYMKSSASFRTFTVKFYTAETAVEALQANQDAKISGKKINVHCSKNSSVICYTCKEQGHMVQNCPQNNQDGSRENSPQENAKKLDIKKLYITDLPMDTTINQVADLFPTAWHIQMNCSTVFRSATILFNTVEQAAEALHANQDVEISGKKISVVYFPVEKRNGGNSTLPPSPHQEIVSDQEIVMKLFKSRIYLISLPMDTTITHVANLFPKAERIKMKSSFLFSNCRAATVKFNTAETAAEALQAGQNVNISGKKFVWRNIYPFDCYICYDIGHVARCCPQKENNSTTEHAAKKAKVEDDEDE